jgi:hypothetical protein
MVHAILKPDTLNGQQIFRPVVNDGGIPTIVSNTVAFPPTIDIVYPTCTNEEIAEMALGEFITISEDKPPELQAMAKMFRKQIFLLLRKWSQRSAINERTIIVNELRKFGFAEAATSVAKRNHQPE